MSDTLLKKIKYRNIEAILTSIARTKSVTRAEIAESTGLSLVTVGKVAEFLLDADMISQVMESRPHAGRRAGALSMNEKKFVIMIDIGTSGFRASCYNLRMELMCDSSYEYAPHTLFSENAQHILAEILKDVLARYELSDCLAVGVSVEGTYIKERDIATDAHFAEISSVNIRAAVSRYFPTSEVVVCSQANAAALYNAARTGNYRDKGVLYWYVGREYIGGAYVLDGSLLGGKNSRVCDFGKMLQFNDLSLEDKVRMAKEPDACAEAVAPALCNVLRILDPHTVIMEFDTAHPTDGIVAKIKDLLTKKYRLKDEELPEFISAIREVRSSHRGLAMEIRHNLLEKLLYSKESII